MTPALAFAALAALGLVQLGLTPHPWQPALSLHQAGVLLAAGGVYAVAILEGTRMRYLLVTLCCPLYLVAVWTCANTRGPFAYAGTAAACCLVLAALAGHLGAPAGPALALLAMAGVWASGSRAAALAGLVAFAPLVVTRVRTSWATLAGALVGGALFAFPGLADPPGRWEHWRRALSRAEYAPWLGTGLLSEYPELAHNDWLQMRADLGGIGLALLLLAVGSALLAMRRSSAPWLVAGCAALVCQSVVDFPLSHPVTLCLFTALAGTAAAFTPEVKS
jgi:hypothetical protein